MQTEEYTDPAAFLAAVQGKTTRKKKAKGSTRLPAGEGDRVPDLMTLAARGWTCYASDGREHWMSGRAGVSGRYESYRAMLDGLLGK